MKNKIKNIFVRMEEKSINLVRYIHELRNIHKKKNLYKKVKLSKEEKQKIKNNFKKYYGRNYSNKWHRLYASYTGKMDADYFPEILYATKLETKLNDYAFSKQICDKSLIEILFSNIDGLKFPKTYILNASNVLYDSNRNIINKEKVITILSNIGRCLIKPTRDTSSGKNVTICDFKNGIDVITQKSITEVLDKYSKNYIIQEVLNNSSELSKIYPNSLNTFRLITYIVNDKIYHCPVVLRIGRGGKFVDNAHAGGLAIGVDDDGYLKKYAFSEYGEKFEVHPDTKTKFNNYKINDLNKMIKIAYSCHIRIPNLKILSWDMAINDKNEIILIEVNTFGESTWFTQYCNGKSLFGENTKYMYSLIRRK